MSRPLNVLVVDDDHGVRSAIVDFLTNSGLSAAAAADAARAEQQLASATFDAIILDVMLPGEDGLSLCRRLATNGPPIVIVSAMGSTVDRIVGLELGAADYLAKPFEPRELLARIRSVVRERARGPVVSPRSRLGFDGLVYDIEARSLTDVHGCPVALTGAELRLLDVFAQRPGRLLDRATLLDLTHSHRDGPFDRAIDLLVSRLRRKLGDAGGGDLIETVRGEGYRFCDRVERR